MPNLAISSGPEASLPDGVRIVRLTTHQDTRGGFTEIFREEWLPTLGPCQWNLARSEPGVLRGVHVHRRHSDYLVLASGHCTFGLCDLRRGSPTERLSVSIDAEGQAPYGLVIPPGVAHGFFFHSPSLHVYAVTHYWNEDDELGCRWDDPDLKIDWPTRQAKLSVRDQALPALIELLPKVSPWIPS